ncbi:phage portal protein [Lactococcus garvieae subsp. garvieae]|uniref:phage portal protein n=1 Tax=Lactococcus garvieae TaxID=1363 RepID=UPI0005AA7BD6|nr:phage portal protein [Lactococcus garvieae]KAA8718813.1 phage portal protein [Lactococcus garvieae subsp. garvieae]MDG6191146.1 phage portal protein [Lactococcus garvieae]PCS00299.1 portal protein [Lactococcus garvieae]QPR48984.1 phage portal protein [Lactococcus garvieae]
MPVFNLFNSSQSPPKSKRGIQDYFPDGNDGALLEQLLGGDERWVSAQTALRNSDLFAIILQLSNDLANIKMSAEKKKNQGIIDRPSTNANTHGFWQSMFAQLLLGGEAFAYRWRNVNGSDLKWEFLRPSQVNTYYDEYENGLYYNVTFDDPKIGSIQQAPQSNMIHLRLLSIDGGKTGISPLYALGREFKIQKASDNLTVNALKNSMNISGVLNIEKGGLLNDKDKAARSKAFMKRSRSGGPVVLDSLESFTPLEIKSNVAQLLSQTDWTSKQFAKVFGLPDSYVGGQGDQQSSIEQISGMYASALNRYIRPVISELEYKLNDTIKVNVWQAIDPLGDSYMSTMSKATKTGILAQNQALFLLQKMGYIPEQLPEGKNLNPITMNVKPVPTNEEEGSEVQNE